MAATDDTSQQRHSINIHSGFHGSGVQNTGSGSVHVGRDLIVDQYVLQTQNRKPFSTIPFRPDPHFVDRPYLLAWLDERCMEPAARVALVGLGGIGKSQIAIEFCHRLSAKTLDTYVFWVHCSTRARFEEAYWSIAARLGLPGTFHSQVNILRLVHDWLSNEENGKWVMILDNLDDGRVFFPDMSTLCQPTPQPTPLATYLPQCAHGRILLTSRNRAVALRLTGDPRYIREMRGMDECSAVRLLCNKLFESPSLAEATSLVRLLEGIPLAITQAAAYVNQRTCTTMRSYLDEFQKSYQKKARLLLKDTGDQRRDASASHSVIMTWRLSFEHMSNIRPSATDLLSLMSYFNPQSIPLWILRKSKFLSAETQSNSQHAHKLDCNTDLEDDIEMLEAFCLVRKTTEYSIEIYALVQHSTRTWVVQNNWSYKWEAIFLKLMHRVFPDGRYAQWPVCEELFPHTATLLNMKPPDELVVQWADLLTNIARFMWQKTNYTVARHAAAKAVEAKRHVLGDGHLSTLRSWDCLALIIQDQGDYNEAEQILVPVAQSVRKELGDRDPFTLAVLNHLALALGLQRKYEMAEELIRRVLTTRQEQLGDVHPDTLSSLSHLVKILYRKHEYEEAEEIIRRVIIARQNALGERHPRALVSVNLLALILAAQGKYMEAEELVRPALEDMRYQAGESHHCTLEVMETLGVTLFGQCKYDEAEDLFNSCFRGLSDKLGGHHTETLRILWRMEAVLQAQGKHKYQDGQ